jgi:SAM-dependent methyltransferase
MPELTPEQRADIARRLTLPDFPRSQGYDPVWQLDNLMGPNALWLTESLTGVMDFRPGMRVLDLGAGKAMSSVFLAREFEVEVWAADLWITPDENWARIREEKLGDRIFPIHAEAHALPFAGAFFDAIVSIDAYHYFGTSELYTETIARFLKPGGQIGIAVPGLTREIGNGVPAHLEPYWEPAFWSFHSAGWWRDLWERTGPITVEHADMVPDGWAQWLLWQEVCRDFGYGYGPEELEMLARDRGELLGFVRMVGRKVG